MNASQLYEVFPNLLAGALVIAPILLIGFVGWAAFIMNKKKST